MILFRYIAKELFSTLVYITLLLITILLLNGFINYINQVVSGRLTMSTVFHIMTLQIPYLLGYLLPIALYLSIYLVIGRLCVDQEMVVMQACGMGFRTIFSYIASCASVVFALVLGLMLVVLPQVQSMRHNVIASMRAQGVVRQIFPQSFFNFGQGKTFYASKVTNNHTKLKDIFFAEYDSGDKGTWKVTTAQDVEQSTHEQWPGKFLVFNQAHQFIFDRGTGEVRRGQFDEYGINMDTEGDSGRTLGYDEKPTMQLWQAHAHDLKALGEFNWRLSMPIAVLLLSLFIIPLSFVKNRGDRYLMLFPALIVYLIYYELMFLSRTMTGGGFITPDGAFWMAHGFLALCCVIAYSCYFGWMTSGLLKLRRLF